MKEFLDEQQFQSFSGPVEIIKLYGGEVMLRYSDKLHAYYYEQPDGYKLLVPGITTVTDCLDKSGPLMQWAANMMAMRLKQQLLSDKFFYPIQPGDAPSIVIPTEQDLTELLDDGRLHYREVSEEATTIGKGAHDWLEKFLRSLKAGKSWEGPLPESKEALNCIKAALDWIEKHKYQPVASERKVCSRQYWFAGTLDQAGLVTACGDPKCCPFEGALLVIADFKTSKRHYEQYALQTAAYKFAYDEEAMFLDPNAKPVGGRLVLRLDKEEGAFDPLFLSNDRFDSDFDAYLGLLTVYNWMKQLQVDKAHLRDVEKLAAKIAKAGTQKKPRRVKVPPKPVMDIPIEGVTVQ